MCAAFYFTYLCCCCRFQLLITLLLPTLFLSDMLWTEQLLCFYLFFLAASYSLYFPSLPHTLTCRPNENTVEINKKRTDDWDERWKNTQPHSKRAMKFSFWCCSLHFISLSYHLVIIGELFLHLCGRLAENGKVNCRHCDSFFRHTTVFMWWDDGGVFVSSSTRSQSGEVNGINAHTNNIHSDYDFHPPERQRARDELTR